LPQNQIHEWRKHLSEVRKIPAILCSARTEGSNIHLLVYPDTGWKKPVTKVTQLGAKATAGTPQPSDSNPQQRLEELEQLADISACIFDELSFEERSLYASQQVWQEVA